MRRLLLDSSIIAALGALSLSCVAGDNYGQWRIKIGMKQRYIEWGSDLGTFFGAYTDSRGGRDNWDTVHMPVGDPDHDLAWIYVADRGGDGGWDEFTGEYEEFPAPGLLLDLRAPYGPGTIQPGVRWRTWAVEVHAPNVPEYSWELVWEIDTYDGWHIPTYPFVVRILPNATFPDGLDLTSYGPGIHQIEDLPQWGPEARIWLIEAGIVPEPGWTWLVGAGVVAVGLAVRRRRS